MPKKITTPDIKRPPKKVIKALQGISAATAAGELRKLGIRDPSFVGPLPRTPGKKVIGPAITLQFMPIREDVYNVGEYTDPELQLHRHALYHTQPGDVVCFNFFLLCFFVFCYSVWYFMFSSFFEDTLSRSAENNSAENKQFAVKLSRCCDLRIMIFGDVGGQSHDFG